MNNGSILTRNQISKTELYRLYITEKRTQAEIGKQFGRPQVWVERRLKAWGIPARRRCPRGHPVSDCLLRRMYLVEKMSGAKIAALLSSDPAYPPIDPTTVIRRLRRAGVEIRKSWEGKVLSQAQARKKTRRPNPLKMLSRNYFT